MMPPPTMMHQRLARELEGLLNARLSAANPDWEADREIGVLLSDDAAYNPEPDVLVVDAAFRMGQIYAERFYFVAEILSPNDKARVLDLKLQYYRNHENCRGVMFIDQEAIKADLHVRAETDWQKSSLLAPADRIVIPGIGDIGSLGELYRHTPLWRPDFGI